MHCPMGHRLLRFIDNLSRADDVLATTRILVERAQNDPMAAAFHDPSDQATPFWTPLHMYTGPTEGLKYMLYQDTFTVDISSSVSDGQGVTDTHMRSFWDHSAGNTRLLLAYGRKTNTNTLSAGNEQLLLHCAISKFSEFHAALSYTKSQHSHALAEEVKQQIQGLIRDALNLNLSLHTLDRANQTPFLRLSCNQRLLKEDLHADFCQRLVMWLDILHQTGYNLKSYILAECETLRSLGQGTGLKISRPGSIFIDRYTRSKCIFFARVMVVEQQIQTGAILLLIEEAFVWSEKEQARIAKGKQPHSTNYMADLHIEPWGKQRLRISIGALCNGKQDVRILEKSAEKVV